MKEILRFTILLSFLLTISWTFKADGILDGLWTLVCYSDLQTGQQNCRILDHHSSIVLDFEDDGQQGKMKGHTTSNQVGGKYELFDDNKIKVKEFGGTKRGEGNKWGYDFWTAIHQSTSYEFKSDTLIIYYDNDTKAMKFARTEKNGK